MRLITIGSKMINLDNVSDIDLDWRLTEEGPSTVLARFVGPGGEAGQEVWLKDDEADALRWYLAEQAYDVLHGYGLHCAEQALKAKIEDHGFDAGAEGYALFDRCDVRGAWQANWTYAYDRIGRSHDELADDIRPWWQDAYRRGWDAAAECATEADESPPA